MKFMLLICGDKELTESRLSPKDVENMTDVEDWVSEMDGRGVRLMGERLRPAGDARTVRRRDGELLVSDGPFAETKEHIAGFDILECQTMDEAIAVAAKHPMATMGTIEVRAFWPFDEG
jgi:hypothetical protein